MIPYELVTIIIFVAVVAIWKLKQSRDNAIKQKEEFENHNKLLREDNYNHQCKFNKEIAARREAERVLDLSQQAEVKSAELIKEQKLKIEQYTRASEIVIANFG